MKFAKVPVGSRFRFPNSRDTVYLKTEKGVLRRDRDGMTRRITLSADDEVVVLPTCEACKLLEPFSAIWLLNWCWTC
jgi:hypothetical protein